MVLRTMEAGMVKCGFQAELSMTLENNVMINRFIESLGAHRYKTYRIYSKSIAQADAEEMAVADEISHCAW